MNEMEYFADPKWGVDPEALNRLKLVASSTFERCSYTKAIQILKDALAKVSLPGQHDQCLAAIYSWPPCPELLRIQMYSG
jgi:hypothetical protein